MDFEIEIAADGAPHAGCRFRIGEYVAFPETCHRQPPFVMAVHGDDIAPLAVGADQPVGPAPPVIDPAGQFGGGEKYVDVMGQRGIADHLNAGGGAYQAVGAVAPGEIGSPDPTRSAGVEIADRRGHAVRILGEFLQPGAVLQSDAGEFAYPRLQDGIEQRLRAAPIAVRRMGHGAAFGIAGVIEPRQFVAGHSGHEGNVQGKFIGPADLADPGGDTPAPAEFHRPARHHVHLRETDGAVALVDQDAVDIHPPEFGGQRQANRTAADDQHLSCLRRRFPRWRRLNCRSGLVFCRHSERFPVSGTYPP